MAILPEIKELLLDRYWNYWTRDYWKGSRNDPLKKVKCGLIWVPDCDRAAALCRE